MLGSFRHLVDINFICAMGPPGGGRNPITPRLLRHFNLLSFTELEDASKYRIFSRILASWMEAFPGADELVPKIVDSTVSVYSTITREVCVCVCLCALVCVCVMYVCVNRYAYMLRLHVDFLVAAN